MSGEPSISTQIYRHKNKLQTKDQKTFVNSLLNEKNRRFYNIIRLERNQTNMAIIRLSYRVLIIKSK
jgi:hypothetical protein